MISETNTQTDIRIKKLVRIISKSKICIINTDNNVAPFLKGSYPMFLSCKWAFSQYSKLYYKVNQFKSLQKGDFLQTQFLIWQQKTCLELKKNLNFRPHCPGFTDLTGTSCPANWLPMITTANLKIAVRLFELLQTRQLT